MDFAQLANSAIIGVDAENAKQQVFLCNPFEVHCIFDSYPTWPAKTALLTQWFTSIWTVFLQLWIFYSAIIQDISITIDTTSPYIHQNTGIGYGLFFWVLLLIWQVVSNSSIIVVGLITDIF
jgi:hypothetical protein